MTGPDPLGGLGSPAPHHPPPAAPASGPAPQRLVATGPPPLRKTPTAVALVLVLGAFFIAQSWLGDWDMQEPLAIFRLGALNWSAVLAGDVFRLGSYSFLHFGLPHFLLNAWALWILMRLIESAYGSVSALGLYAISVIAGGLGSTFSALAGQNPYLLAAGASGGIAGLFGAYVALWLRLRKRLPPEASRAALRMLVANFGLNVLIALLASANGTALDNSAHLGGLAAGLLFGLLAPLAVLPRRFWSRPAQVALVLAAFALASMEGAAVARAVHPHTRLLRGEGCSAETPWMLVPVIGLVAVDESAPAWLQLPLAAHVGVAVSPGGIGLRALIARSSAPLLIAPGSEAVPIGDRTWLRLRDQGNNPEEEVQILSARQGTGSLLIKVLCDTEKCHGAMADEAAIQLARTLRADPE